MEELRAAVPELGFLQPRTMPRYVLLGESQYVRRRFGQELAAAVGAVARPEVELGAAAEIGTVLADVAPLLQRLRGIPPLGRRSLS